MSKFLKGAIKIIEARDPFLGGATRADFGDDMSGGYPDEFYGADSEADTDIFGKYESLMNRFDKVVDEMSDEEGDAWDSAMNAADAQMEYGDDDRAEAYLGKAEDVLDQVEKRIGDSNKQPSSQNFR